MSRIDNPDDPRAEIRDILRRLRDLETHASLRNASLSAGEITLLVPGEDPDAPGGQIVAGDVKISARDGGNVAAGGAKISAANGGEVGAGGTKISSTGKISNDSNKLEVASNTEFAGNVKAAGTFEGAAVEASGTRIDSDGSIKRTGGGALKVGTNTEFAGNATAKGAFYGEMGVVIPLNGGMNQAGPAIEAAKARADEAWQGASDAWQRGTHALGVAEAAVTPSEMSAALAGKANQSEVDSVQQQIGAIKVKINAIIDAHNAKHPDAPVAKF